MTTKQSSISLKTNGRGMIDVTAQIAAVVVHSKIETGLCNIFLHHTSASLIICENYDPKVLSDLEAFIKRLIPDGDALFEHTAEGVDDMPAHIRTVLTQSSITIPVTNHLLNLGQWQGIFLWEHRLKGHQRKLTITVQD